LRTLIAVFMEKAVQNRTFCGGVTITGGLELIGPITEVAALTFQFGGAPSGKWCFGLPDSGQVLRVRTLII
jgi:hypothetical protein